MAVIYYQHWERLFNEILDPDWMRKIENSWKSCAFCTF